MKKYVLKNGSFVVITFVGKFYLNEMDDNETVSFAGVNCIPAIEVVGYRRTRDSYQSDFVPPLSPKEAYEAIKRLGLDDDLVGSGLTVTNQNSPWYAPPSPIVDYEWETLKKELNHEPKCDCGGVKCKLPCYHWCSTQKNN